MRAHRRIDDPQAQDLSPAAPASPDPFPGAVLSAKLHPPSTHAAQVPRTAVSDLVCAAPSVKLVLVRAPAGFGKTTAMMQCRARLEENGTATGWLTLDRADNDGSRFLGGLAAAVASMNGDEAASHSTSAGDMALALVDRLARHSAPFVLFLDDFELIHEPAVIALVRELIAHLPRRGQLVVGSRSLPDLSLGRLRARGQLLEVDADHLRFTLADTMEFFRRRGQLPLAVEDLALLHRKTEGWVAVLWLASVALERRDARSEFIARFSGSDQAVADYLAEDVLTRQPPAIRSFLLRTSVLRHLNASLCDALNPGIDSAGMLEQLAAANLFLTPIEGDDRSYRYHSLFGDFLRAQLQRDDPGAATALHRAASRWYEAERRPVPAIDHALEGGDVEQALVLLGQHAEDLLAQGRMRLLARWFAALPEDCLQSRPQLQVVHLWALSFTRGPWEAMARLAASACAHSTDPDVRANVLALRPMLLTMMDRHEDAYAIGRDSLAQLPSTKPFADSVLTNAMAVIVSVLGEHREAHQLLDAARRAQGDGWFNRMYSETVEGIIDLLEGRLQQATARFRMAVHSTHTASYSHTHGNAWAGVLYAGAVYEADQLPQAEHLLRVYVPLARDVGLPDHMIVGYTMLSRIAFHRGDIDQSFQVLTELEYLGYERQLPRVVASAKLERSRLLLLQGHGQAARDELERAAGVNVWQRARHLRLTAHDLDYLELAQWRWEIVFGKAEAVLPRLEREIGAATQGARHRRALKLRCLHAHALQRSGKPAAALATMTEVLRLACAEGFRRLVLDEGDGVGALVLRVAEAFRQGHGERRDPLFGACLQQLVQAIGPLAAADGEADTNAAEASAQASDAGPLDPLTRKEIRVLELLAEGYSNGAMAEKLFVSDSTVRTHLRNINSKLGVHSRTRAVAVARGLGLIR